jgi:hypothetical protein
MYINCGRKVKYPTIFSLVKFFILLPSTLVLNWQVPLFHTFIATEWNHRQLFCMDVEHALLLWEKHWCLKTKCSRKYFGQIKWSKQASNLRCYVNRNSVIYTDHLVLLGWWNPRAFNGLGMWLGWGKQISVPDFMGKHLWKHPAERPKKRLEDNIMILGDMMGCGWWNWLRFMSREGLWH